MEEVKEEVKKGKRKERSPFSKAIVFGNSG